MVYHSVTVISILYIRDLYFVLGEEMLKEEASLKG